MKHLATLLLASLTLFSTAWAADNNGFLEPGEAFKFSARADSAQRITLHWDIADGYYLYRDRIKVESQTAGSTAGALELPPAKAKQDPNFGEMMVYHHALDVGVPLQHNAAVPGAVALKIRYQGCAEAGLCYMPVTLTETFTLPTLASSDSAPPAASLSALFEQDKNDFLPVEQAFPFSARWENNAILLQWDVQPGYYLYRKAFEVVDAPSGVSFGALELPTGSPKHDEHFGEVEVYETPLTAKLPVQFTNTPPAQLNFTVKYQGCADQGICYQPMQTPVTVTPSGATPAASQTTAAATTNASPASASEDENIAQKLKSDGLLTSALSFYLFGLLLAFTPCILPMVPILSSIITGQGEKLSPARGLALSMTYVQPMALTFALVGVFVGMSGKQLNAILQSPPFLGTFGVILLLLSLSMFGVFKMQMPSGLQAKIAELSNRQQGGNWIGVAIMGFLSSLIVGPCVTPPLVGTLLYISQEGSPLVGGVVLYTMALGMGTPLLLVGASAGFLLPKVGAWMARIQHVFGLMILGLALWLTAPIVPEAIQMVMWALLMLGTGVYLGALEPLGDKRTGWPVIGKMLGIAALLYGVIILYGFAQGGRSPWQPLTSQARPAAHEATATAHPNFKRVKTAADVEREVAVAKAQGKAVMLDFYADWCVSCKEYENITFVDPTVQASLAKLVLLQADVTAGDASDEALMKSFPFKIQGPPVIVFWDTQGQLQPSWRISGFKNPTDFQQHLNQTVLP
jgi:thioredoxin:protein disulfide reductase